ncbi:hypothetical protein Bbelb_023930 [Branchiostoma belcheri]|nr:hypothetical protein Bbelb_023930 [Branchiostoma belcheri]
MMKTYRVRKGSHQMLQMLLFCWLGIVPGCLRLAAADGADHTNVPSLCPSSTLPEDRLEANDENGTKNSTNDHGNISKCFQLSAKTNGTRLDVTSPEEESELERNNFHQVKAFIMSSSNLDQSVVPPPYGFGTANFLLVTAAIVPILGLLFILYPCIRSVLMDTPFCKKRLMNRRLRSSRLTLASDANDSSDDEIFGLSDGEKNTRGAQEVMTVSCITTKNGDVCEQEDLEDEQLQEKVVILKDQ